MEIQFEMIHFLSRNDAVFTHILYTYKTSVKLMIHYTVLLQLLRRRYLQPVD